MLKNLAANAGDAGDSGPTSGLGMVASPPSRLAPAGKEPGGRLGATGAASRILSWASSPGHETHSAGANPAPGTMPGAEDPA